MAKPSTSDRRWRPQLVLHTRIGRRFAALFVLCALIPVSVFGVLADRAVHSALRAQAFARVQRGGKDAGSAIQQQLAALDQRLSDIIEREGDPTTLQAIEPRIRRVDSSATSVLTPEQEARVRAHKALLRVRLGAQAPTIELVRWAPRADDSTRTLVASIDLRRMIGGVSGLDLVPPASRLCTNIAGMSLGCVNAIDSDEDGESPILATTTVFLRYEFGAPALTLTILESDEAAFAPLGRFRELFIPIAIVAVCLAAFLAQVTIRRQTAPLSALDAGTERIAAGDFSHRVAVQGDDEFSQLALAFNGMTSHLSRQFHSLELHHDVDVAVLGATSRASVSHVLLSRIGAVVPCDRALLLMSPSEGRVTRRDGWRLKGVHDDGTAALINLSEAEHAELSSVPAHGVSLPAGGHRSYLRTMPTLRAEVYPVRVGGVTEGALLLGFGARALSDDDRRLVRQMVARVAVAFSNLQLVDDLRAMSTGALEALARTTDAASPWTAGHSVRVTSIAVALARADGADKATVELVRRGALLHDIGKIAVPVAILDKPAALTAEERAVINTHPTVGERILQPIAAFASLLPMVRSHHERWDGTGYPDQLRGEAIHPLARLLAVADVAESMLAARPYRAALPLDYVADFIRENAGRHFDPRLAHLFADGVANGDEGLLLALKPLDGAASTDALQAVA